VRLDPSSTLTVIRRTRAEAPPTEYAIFARQALEKLRQYDSQRALIKSQRRWPFELAAVYELEEVLSRAFTHLCAYCESPVAQNPLIEWHRPREEAMQLDGTISRDHYWWLAYDWKNLYLVCIECQKYKGPRFPVAAARAAPEARDRTLDQEQPLLLDPCSDYPERVFRYATDGTIVPTDERSETTIEVLELNRASLQRPRREAIEATEQGLRDGVPVNNLRQQFEEGMPYAGVRRWTARKTLLQRGDDAMIVELGLDDSRALTQVRATLDTPVRQRQKTLYEMSRHRRSQPRIVSNVTLETVEISNFRAITDISLSFRDLRPDTGEPWMLLLGENGVGKSSVLKAIALALMGTARKQFVPNASDVVRHGARRGEVRLGFSDGSTLLMGFRKGEEEFSVPISLTPRVLVGYGPTRLPPPRDTKARRPSRFDVDNLFDPWATLSDAESWLADQKRVPAKRFNLLATDLKTLLPMSEADRLSRREGRLYAKSYGSTVPLSQLSDGYRSVIALATDLMLRLSASVDSMRAAEGLLLIDEIEVHLHPQWRMTIVNLLREVFPRLRVIATTHDPLCLQQTEPGEVFLLRRIGNSKVEAVQRDVPKGLRADQLLTGDWFGLSNTTDAETSEMLAEHGRLLIAKATPEVRRARRTLEAQIRERVGHFAETSIERLAQDVTARIVDEESIELGKAEPEERERLAESVMEAIRRKRRRTP
jgi:uncharacterized protein (TIGR02646 family)